MTINFDKEVFAHRHNGPDQESIKSMLGVIKADSLDKLIDETIPNGIRLQKPLDLPEALSEADFLSEFKSWRRRTRSISPLSGWVIMIR